MKVFHFRRAWAIARKEVMHILRDPFTMVVAVAIPVFLTIMFGFAIDLDIRNVHMAVFDADLSHSSRYVYQKFIDSKYFVIKDMKTLTRSPEQPLSREKAKLSLIIPRKFEENLFNGRGGKVQALLDGADNTTVNLLTGYLGGIEQALNSDYEFAEELKRDGEKLKLVPRFLFNPQQESSWFVVPGLSTVILAILATLLTSLTIAREWETGSMELLLSTPARPAEIIFGKLIPYVVLGLMAMTLIYVAARTVFHIPFTGSHIAYIAATLLFVGAYLSMGLFISVVAKNQQLAMQMSIMAGYMPSTLLSGFIFSIENMSPFWQKATALLPARWYMVACRACYLKGASFGDLAVPFVALIILGSLMFFAATRKFRGNLEN